MFLNLLTTFGSSTVRLFGSSGDAEPPNDRAVERLLVF